MTGKLILFHFIKIGLIFHKTLLLGHKLTKTFYGHMTNKMADYVVKACFGTDEKDRFLSNLKLYRIISQ